MDVRLRADWTLLGPFWQDFFPLPNVRSWLQREKPKSCKKKCSKWVYRKWILEYLELNETYLLFGRNSRNSHLILTLLDFHTDHTALKKCSAILAKKQVGFMYSKIHFLYTHFEHFFLQLLGFSRWSQDLTFGRGKKSRQKGPERVQPAWHLVEFCETEIEYLMDDVKPAGNEPKVYPFCRNSVFMWFSMLHIEYYIIANYFSYIVVISITFFILKKSCVISWYRFVMGNHCCLIFFLIWKM